MRGFSRLGKAKLTTIMARENHLPPSPHPNIAKTPSSCYTSCLVIGPTHHQNEGTMVNAPSLQRLGQGLLVALVVRQKNQPHAASGSWGRRGLWQWAKAAKVGHFPPTAQAGGVSVPEGKHL
jgi:hypothetical protein